jgi:hypothetical protein
MHNSSRVPVPFSFTQPHLHPLATAAFPCVLLVGCFARYISYHIICINIELSICKHLHCHFRASVAIHCRRWLLWYVAPEEVSRFPRVCRRIVSRWALRLCSHQTCGNPSTVIPIRYCTQDLVVLACILKTVSIVMMLGRSQDVQPSQTCT